LYHHIVLNSQHKSSPEVLIAGLTCDCKLFFKLYYIPTYLPTYKTSSRRRGLVGKLRVNSIISTIHHLIFLIFSEILLEERNQLQETMKRENRRVQAQSWSKFIQKQHRQITLDRSRQWTSPTV